MLVACVAVAVAFCCFLFLLSLSPFFFFVFWLSWQQPLKRAKSDGSEPKDVATGEARARMDRAFTMPQFVTSVAGYGGSARAKQVSTHAQTHALLPVAGGGFSGRRLINPLGTSEGKFDGEKKNDGFHSKGHSYLGDHTIFLASEAFFFCGARSRTVRARHGPALPAKERSRSS